MKPKRTDENEPDPQRCVPDPADAVDKTEDDMVRTR